MVQSPQTFFQFDSRRFRSYVFRLPLGVRVVLAITTAFLFLDLFLPWFGAWASLIPSDVHLTSMHRLTTYPFLHYGFFHFFINILALTPLIERFEAENGSLVTLILFTGPFATLPGGSYTLLERYLFYHDTPVAGLSVWVFLLLGNEAVKTYKANPSFQVGPVSIPTWTTPLALNLVIAVLIPGTSFVGHSCGLAVGYVWGFGWVRFLAPSEKILRWIEGKLNLLSRVPHYVSVDQKTYGRYGVLPSTSSPRTSTLSNGSPASYIGSSQRLGS